MKSLKSQNYYEMLGVAPEATSEQIREAYEISKHTFQENSLATYSLFTDAENQEILTLISRAYETLFNPEKRREYDFQMGRVLPGKPQSVERSANPQPLKSTQQALQLGNSQGNSERDPFIMAEESIAFPPARTSAAPAPPGAPLSPPARMPGAFAAPAASVASSPSRSGNVQTGEGSNQNDAKVEKLIQETDEFSGLTLRKARQIRGMSLADVAEHTKIRKAYLEYLEEENFEFLPASVYVKGFVVNVSNLLGLPSRQASEDYMARYRRMA